MKNYSSDNKRHENMKLGLFIPTFEKDYNKIESTLWIRVLQLKKYYERLGVSVHINNFFLKYDVAIFYRGCDNKAYYILKLLKITSRKIYWDQVVNYFEKHEKNTFYQVKNAVRIAMLVDGIIVSTDFLKIKAEKLNKNVFVMPDSIDTEKFNLSKKKINLEKPKFIWSGVSQKAVFLNDYSENISGRIILITDNNIKNINLNFKYKYIPWKYETFESDILRGDVCLAPRKPDNKYDKCHSSFKIIVFANAEIPIICDKIPSYVKLSKKYKGIQFLEDNNNDIFECIEKMKEIRFSNQEVISEYSCKSVAKQLITYLEQEMKK